MRTLLPVATVHAPTQRFVWMFTLEWSLHQTHHNLTIVIHEITAREERTKTNNALAKFIERWRLTTKHWDLVKNGNGFESDYIRNMTWPKECLMTGVGVRGTLHTKKYWKTGENKTLFQTTHYLTIIKWECENMFLL